jgi:hypothetical protein
VCVCGAGGSSTMRRQQHPLRWPMCASARTQPWRRALSPLFPLPSHLVEPHHARPQQAPIPVRQVLHWCRARGQRRQAGRQAGVCVCVGVCVCE